MLLPKRRGKRFLGAQTLAMKKNENSFNSKWDGPGTPGNEGPVELAESPGEILGPALRPHRAAFRLHDDGNANFRTRTDRSEEHTSELQSHHDLVCRLLLEKKKNKNQTKHK